MTVSHVWRALGATEPVWEVTTTTDTYRDDRVASIATTLTCDPAGALSEAAAEVTVVGAAPPTMDDPLTVQLTDYGATLLPTIFGQGAAAIRLRYRGRIADRTVTDYGNPADALRATTTLSAQAWHAQAAVLGESPTTYPAGTSLDTIARDIMPVGLFPVVAAGVLADAYSPHGYLTADLALSKADAIGRLAEVGYQWSARRNGSLRAATCTGRYEQGQALPAAVADGSTVPLMRRQVVAPAQWAQTPTTPRVYPVTWTNAGVTSVLQFGAMSARRAVIREEPYNSTWMRDGGDLVPASALAKGARTTDTGYAVQAVTLNVLALLRTGIEWDRRIVGQVLALEAGDPLALSYDWPPEVAGIYFTTSIAEQITPTSWTIALELAPHAAMTGQPSPAVPGPTWDTAYPATTTWDTAPATTTWESTP